MQHFLFFVLFALAYSEFVPNCDINNKCPGNISKCSRLDYNAAQCDCLNTALNDAGCTRCNMVTISNAVACTVLGAITRANKSSTYDFMTCNACSNPPGDSTVPAACPKAFVNFIDRLLPFNRQYTLPTIPTTCSLLNDFYNDLSNCGFQGLTRELINQYVCGQTDERFALCQCDGKGVSPLGNKIINTLKKIKQEVIDYFVELYGKAGKLGTVDIDTTRTYNCDDRVVVKFTGTFDGQQIKDAYAKYLGIDVSRVVVGVNVQDEKVGGVCTTVVDFSIQTKRDELQATSATVQIKDGSGAGTLIISQFVILLCALIYFL